MHTTNLWAASGTVFRTFDGAATFLWALTGAARGARRGYDLTGILAVALAASCGGGLLRDALFLQAGPPVLVRSPLYLILAALAAVGLWILGPETRRRTSLLAAPWLACATALADGLGLGAFAVVGMRLASTAGIGAVGAALIGVVNAVGGGLLSSALLQETPEVLRPGHFTAVAAAAGTMAYGALDQGLGLAPQVAGGLTITLVACLHWASLRYRLHTHAAWNLASGWTSSASLSPSPQETTEP